MKFPFRLLLSNSQLSRQCHFSYYRFMSDINRPSRTALYSTYTVAHNLVSRGLVSPRRCVPDEIIKPDYVSGNRFSRAVRERVSNKRKRANIEIKSDSQIQGMRDACRFEPLTGIDVYHVKVYNFNAKPYLVW